MCTHQTHKEKFKSVTKQFDNEAQKEYNAPFSVQVHGIDLYILLNYFLHLDYYVELCWFHPG